MSTLSFSGRKVRMNAVVRVVKEREDGNVVMLIKEITANGVHVDHAWVQLKKNPKMRILKEGDYFEAMGSEYAYVGINDKCCQVKKTGYMGLRPIRKIK